MNEIVRLYPTLSMDRVRELTHIVVTERNAVAERNKIDERLYWGMGCHYSDAARAKIESVDGSEGFEWLRYKRGKGAAYAVLVGNVPLRIQPECEDVRDPTLGELEAITSLRVQESLFEVEPNEATILRLEVKQRPGKRVERATLYLFNMNTKISLDSIEVYSEKTPANVTDMKRPPQDVDLSGLFEFPNASEASNDIVSGDDE